MEEILVFYPLGFELEFSNGDCILALLLFTVKNT